MPEQTDAFESMMRELVRDEGARLLEGEKAWRGLVPDSIDKVAYAAIAAGTAAKAAPAAAGFAVKNIIKAAAVAVAASLVVTGGACVVSPAFRARVSDLLTGTEGAGSAYVQKNADKTPGSYAIPSPGDAYEITDEAVSERVQYKWFTSDEREILVEVAYRLPGNDAEAAGEVLVLSGGLWGAYTEDGGTKTAVLHDGDIDVRITFSNAEKDDILSYAELIASQNAGS